MQKPKPMQHFNFRQLLHQSELKVTPARLAVLEYLKQVGSPLGADSIYDHLRLEHDEADRATIYRILDTFVQKGLIKRINFGEGKYRYELAGDDHHHLVCESCGKIEDIPDCDIQQWEEKIRARRNFLIKRHSLEFFGVCQSCQR